eukprot:1159830-Pelagomonas_calceolata.AAC.3
MMLLDFHEGCDRKGYCEDTRPGQQLEAARRQDADLCELINAKVVTLHTLLLGVCGRCYTEHTLNQFKQLGLDHQRAFQLARKLHAHAVMYANKLVTTRHAIENNEIFHSRVLESGASTYPPDPHSNILQVIHVNPVLVLVRMAAAACWAFGTPFKAVRTWALFVLNR